MSIKCVVPVSGGLDSTVILHWVASEGKEIHAVSYNYGQRHFDQEMRCATLNCDSIADTHKEIDLTFFKDIVTSSSLVNDDIDVAKTKDVLGDPQTVNYVPNRNMMMLSICTAYAESLGATQLYHGSALVDSQAGYWDGSAEFIRAINDVNKLNRRDRVEILAPLITKSKKDIIELGVSLNVDFSNTWTCYEGKTKACGRCPACSSRIQGFLEAGYVDPIEYEVDIPWGEYNCKDIV
ncbi:7-cyano-7-deazaguanine synthase QueC [bacterium]|nr:7-cyano-7-deazaguanine synthase QueC [bacterium]